MAAWEGVRRETEGGVAISRLNGWGGRAEISKSDEAKTVRMVERRNAREAD